MTRFLIIADDFTGSNDTGVQLKKRGLETEVVLDAKSIDNNKLSYVVDTESRGLDYEGAYHRVKSMAENALNHSYQYVYKKLDSTLRGNIGAEIRAVDEIYKPDLILFAPAYPENNRKTISAVQMLKDIPITQTEIARDPIKPVKVDNIKMILEAELKESVTHIYLEELRNGTQDLSLSRIYSFDAETTEDMLSIARLGMTSNKKILWVGSAGLANAMLEVLYPIKPVLAVVGSVSDISRQQANYMKGKADIIRVDIDKLIAEENIEPIKVKAIASLKSGRDAILISASTRQDYEKSIAAGRDTGKTPAEVSSFTQDILSEITKGILTEFKPSGMFLTGGDTAIGVITAIGATGSRVIEELITGIPLMALKGGLCDGLYIVTKAGAFGNEDSLDYCIKKLKEKC